MQGYVHLRARWLKCEYQSPKSPLQPAAGVGANGRRISPDQVETQVQDVTEIPTPDEPKVSLVSPSHSAEDKRTIYHNKGRDVHAEEKTNGPTEKGLQPDVAPPHAPSEKTKEPETNHVKESTAKAKKTQETAPTKEAKEESESKVSATDPKPHSQKTPAQVRPQHLHFTDSEDEARDGYRTYP